LLQQVEAKKRFSPGISTANEFRIFPAGCNAFVFFELAAHCDRTIEVRPLAHSAKPVKWGHSGISSRLFSFCRPVIIDFMDVLVMHLSWEYFLGVMGALIGIAYYTNGRFTGLETDVGLLKDTIGELAINAENVTAKVFKKGSSVSLTATGYHVLKRSGLRSYIDTKRTKLLATLNPAKQSDPYAIERRSFRLLAELPLDGAVGRHLDSFGFNNGISTTLLRRVGAIYLRDIAVSSK
jgi:hypothetical protein